MLERKIKNFKFNRILKNLENLLINIKEDIVTHNCKMMITE